MARLVNYQCDKCGKFKEEIFLNDKGRRPKKLKRKCECGGTFIKNDVKRNCHRWNFMDRPL